MRHTAAILVGLLAVGPLFGAPSVPPVDGVVVSIRSEAEKKGEELRCYRLKDGKAVATTTLYRADDRIISACVSPFGDRVAFIQPGGTVAMVGIDGTGLAELVDDALWVQWPAGDGGRWIYYIDAADKATLRRVNVTTRKSEKLVTFDRTIESAALSQDASPTAGWLLFPGGDSGAYAALYPMARGTGLTFAVPEWWQLTGSAGQRLSISPDGTSFGMLAPDGTFLVVGIPPYDDSPVGYRLDAVRYRNRPATWFREVDWRFSNVADPHSLKQAVRVEEQLGLKQALFVQPVWSVNHPGWVLFARQNYAQAPDAAQKPVSSDLVLWDVAAGAHHGIPSHDNVTENAAGAFERPVGFWQWLPAELSLGCYRGKAPFTVAFAADRIREEMTWDFGDGSPRAKGRTVEHTFTRAGHFHVVAEKGAWAKPLLQHVKDPTDGLYVGDVTVLPPGPPEAQVTYVDATHLLVTFSEPVQAKDAQVSLDGKTKVERWTLDAGGRHMSVQLAVPLSGHGKLRLTGFFDLAQKPVPLQSDTLAIAAPAWPADRAGLVFVWEDAARCSAVVTRGDGLIRRLELFHDGPGSGIDARGRLQTANGSFRTNLRLQNQIGTADLADVILNSTFSFECTFQPDNLTQQALRQPPRVVSIGSHRPYVSLFMIGQQANRLLVSIKTDDNWTEDMGQVLDEKLNPPLKPEQRKGTGPYFYGHGPWVEVATLTDTRPHHLVVTYKPGLMTTYLDGRKVYETDRVTGQLNWGWGMLVLGGHHGLSGGSAGWQGSMEGVAMYNRLLDADEVRRNAETCSRKAQARDAQAAAPKGAK